MNFFDDFVKVKVKKKLVFIYYRWIIVVLWIGEKWRNGRLFINIGFWKYKEKEFYLIIYLRKILFLESI